MKVKKPFLTDRRDAKRYNMPLKLDYIDPTANLKGTALAINISKSGLRFPVDVKMKKGTILDLKLEDPFNHTPIFSKAEVVWVNEFIDGEEPEDIGYEVGVRLSKKRLY